MSFLKQIAVILTITLGLITFAQSETSWIKKKDKNEFATEVTERDFLAGGVLSIFAQLRQTLLTFKYGRYFGQNIRVSKN